MQLPSKSGAASWGHSYKNAAGQAQSWLRTLFYGRFWTDHTAARHIGGMAPSVLSRESPMSDKMNSCFNNPYHLVLEDEPCQLFLSNFHVWKVTCSGRAFSLQFVEMVVGAEVRLEEKDRNRTRIGKPINSD